MKNVSTISDTTHGRMEMSDLFRNTTNHIIVNVEGGYSNRKVDYGGETYKGISRKHWPSWEGWVIIDRYKIEQNFPSILNDNSELHLSVLVFYKENFWDKIKGDDLSTISETICLKLYDQIINFGISRPSKWFQEALNLLNRYERRYNNIRVDGKIGSVTMSTLKKALNHNSDTRILTIMRCFQGMEYISIMRKNEAQEANIGWIDRIIL